MKVSFLERLGAYVLDTIIIGIIASLICSSLPNNDKTIENRITELNKQYTSGEITTQAFYNEYNNLLYENQKATIIPTCVSLVLTIGYFVVFQYLNKGQTFGKRLFNLRVVDSDTEKPPTIAKGIVRSIIVLGILSTIIDLLVVNIGSKKTYIQCYYTVSIIFVVISIALILFKDGRGLHDKMAHTKVIKEGR